MTRCSIGLSLSEDEGWHAWHHAWHGRVCCRHSPPGRRRPQRQPRDGRSGSPPRPCYSYPRPTAGRIVGRLTAARGRDSRCWRPPRSSTPPYCACCVGAKTWSPKHIPLPPTTAVRGRELFPRPDLRNSARARAGQRGARLSLRRLRVPEAVHPRSEAARGALRAPLMRARSPRCDAGRVPGSGRVLELWRVARGTEMECMYNVHCTRIRMRPWVQRLLHRVSIRHSEEGEEV